MCSLVLLFVVCCFFCLRCVVVVDRCFGLPLLFVVVKWRVLLLGVVVGVVVGVVC